MEKSPYFIAIPLLSLSYLSQATEHSLTASSLIAETINSKVITLSKYLENNSDSPANIEIITAKQISDRGYQNLEDLLKNLPGVDIQSYSEAGGYNVVSMRGATNNNKFIILKDGVRISTPSGAINAIADNSPLYLAKRVEVVIGPSSVSYGADAYAGVINIVSYDQDDPNSSNISIAAGEEHYLNSHILYNKLLNNGIYINAGLQGHYSQELDFAHEFPELYVPTTKDYNFKNTDGFQFFADAKINDHFSTGVFHSKITYSSDFTIKPSFSSFDHSLIEESLTSLYANFEYAVTDKLHSTTLFTYQLFTLGNASNFNNIYTDFTKQFKYGRTARYSLQQDFTYQLNPAHLLSAGLSYDYFDIIPRSADLPVPYEVDKKPDEQSFFYPNTELPISFFQQRDENVGIYLQDHWHINEQWRQVSGIRFDHHTLYGDSVSPSLTTIYKANQKNVFKLLFAHSFLTPPSSFAFNSFGSFSGEQNAQGEWLSNPIVPFQVPNKHLDPEVLKSIELNYEYWFTSSSKIKFAPYFNQIDNLILSTNDVVAQQEIVGAQLLKTSSYKNVGEQTAYGFDISTNINFVYDNATLEYWLALSYINGEITTDTSRSELPYTAEYKIKTGFTYNYQNTYIVSPTIRWISNTPGNNLITSNDELVEVESSLVLDIHAQAQITEQLSFKITMNNLLDNKYYNATVGNRETSFDKAPQLGRLVFITMQYDF